MGRVVRISVSGASTPVISANAIGAAHGRRRPLSSSNSRIDR